MLSQSQGHTENLVQACRQLTSRHSSQLLLSRKLCGHSNQLVI